jgi:uncharacterized phage protein gp47/JayE
MPSPDLTPYVDLTVYDRDAQTIVDLAVADLQAKVPDWTMRESNMEVMLIEAMSLIVSEGVYAINRLPGAVVEILLRLYGIERFFGEQPTVTVTFNVADSLGHDIPAGTRVRLVLAGGADPIVFSTDVTLTIPNGSTSGTVAATGDRYTADGNGVLTGTALELLDAVTFVDSAVTATLVVGGQDPEDDTTWLDRGITRLTRLNETLVSPQHFIAAALERPEVQRATALDSYNSDLGTGAPGDHPGHITVVVYGDNAPLSSGEKTAIATDFDLSTQANLAVHVDDPDINTVDVTATLHSAAGYDTTEVQTAVEAAIRGYLSSATWDWGGTVRINELISLIDQVQGVAYVDSITAPATDLTLTGYAPLAVAGTVTLTVTGL